MRKAFFTYMVPIICTFISCETEFIGDHEFGEKTIVIEGWITDLNESQRIIVSKSLNGNYFNRSEYYMPIGDLIDDAIVTISSNTQAGDTLELEFGGFDSTWTGYYITNTFLAKAEETYFLRVEYEGKIYEASAYMPPVPEMDSISYSRKQVEKENATLTIPLVCFTDPVDEENYYLFRNGVIQESYEPETDDVWSLISSTDPWSISIFSDKFINGAAVQLNVMEGITTYRYWMTGVYYFTPGDRFFVQMQSLTKEAYAYYQALIDQLNYAAGVFHPSPANAPTNISNGGQGFFGASSVSRIAGTFPE